MDSEAGRAAVSVRGFSAYYGGKEALRDVSLDVPENCVYALIGPSGCGKTTLLRSINRLNDFVPSFSREGEIYVGGTEVFSLSDRRGTERLRRGIGMVFQQPNPLPISVRGNMALPLAEHFRVPRAEMDARIVDRMKQGAIYDELKDKLRSSALALSGGQQQRLCIARALMLDPPLMLFDEPCSALDPIATYAIEDLLSSLKRDRTIVIVTHNMEQARRVADYTAFFYLGKLVEHGPTERIFSQPGSRLLSDYITGRV
ncbi:MAG: phosphate ABC transporter ATP-binding protein [Clostridiales Family XIII bacterium]|jgi:phosphate transport system ATP-binding protein|nr:phosphate ABC transporter ATP-binding protein [Clostridiales Family XIII bacterium]